MKPDKMLLIAAFIGILIIIYATAATPGTPIGTVESVYDGDTITVALEGGAAEKVRLIGIDAPEIRTNAHGQVHELGPAARAHLAGLIAGETVRLEIGVRERDHYGRIFAYVYHADAFINLEMVRAGYAVTYTVPPDVAHADEFLPAEREARAEGKGLWRQYN